VSSSGGGTAAQAPRAMGCPEARVSLGVYVLGAIEPAERALVDAHLTTCRDCRDELAGLAGLPALLARVSNAEAIALGTADGPVPAEAAGPPPELLATVLDLTSARRRRRWLQASLGAAAAVIVAGGVFGGLSLGSGSPAPVAAAAGIKYPGSPNGSWTTWTGHSGAMAATVSYRSMGWGTELETKVSGIPVGTPCQLWVIDAAGDRALAGSWVTDEVEGTVWYPGSAGLADKNVKAFEVSVGSGQAIEVSA
jgi:hypothetical protein